MKSWVGQLWRAGLGSHVRLGRAAMQGCLTQLDGAGLAARTFVVMVNPRLRAVNPRLRAVNPRLRAVNPRLRAVNPCALYSAAPRRPKGQGMKVQKPRKFRSIPPARIVAARASLTELSAVLDRQLLTPQERAALGGSTYPEGRRVVAQVARALDFAPAAFSHLPQRGEDLRQQQEAADEWLMTALLLEMLLRRCQDRYLAQQGEVLADAMAVVTQVRIEAELPYPPSDQRQHRLRRVALDAAEEILRERQQSIKRRAAKNRHNQQRRDKREQEAGRDPQRDLLSRKK